MLKLIILIILLVNLDLVYGPSASSFLPGKLPILKNFTLNGIRAKFTKLLGNRKSLPSEAISAKSPPSQVAIPKKDLTQGLSRSVSYLALPIEIIKGVYYLPRVLDDYLESTETVSKKSYLRVEFFCPNNNSDEDSCMFPTNQRQCAAEPTPVIRPILRPCNNNNESSQQPDSADVSQNVSESEITADASQNIGDNGEMCSVKCGPRGRSQMYIFAYLLCDKTNSGTDAEKIRNDITDVLLEIFNTTDHRMKNSKSKNTKYTVFAITMENHGKKETIYTHHEMHWPKSLSNEKLKLEQKINFKMSTEDYGYFEKIFKKAENVYENPQNIYQAQKLVPPEDFPLAFWKIPTFHYVNVKPQHQKLVKLWNLISELIRNGSYARYNYKHSIYTGAFRLTNDIDDIEYLGDNKEIEIPKFWVKVILLEDDEKVTRGLAILMYNNTEQNSTIQWERYCVENYCFTHDIRNAIFNDFTDPGFEVRCCSISENIIKLFDLQADYQGIEIENLLVENLT